MARHEAYQSMKARIHLLIPTDQSKCKERKKKLSKAYHAMFKIGSHMP
jgi:hypothetical protein